MVDGTPCDNEGFDVCVDGQCMVGVRPMQGKGAKNTVAPDKPK